MLSVVHNEAHRLSACIAAARKVVSQVVIVVQESTDGTLELARELADVVIEHPCLGLSEPSRPAGLAECSNDWVLYLDADEVLTEWAAERLNEWCDEEADLVMLRRLTKAGDHVLEDLPHPRLFRRSAAKCGDFNHATYHVNNPHRIRSLTNQVSIEHFKTWAEQKADDYRYRMLQPHFRDNTVDAEVWDSINGTHNEYRLPSSMKGWRVLDIGAHIGSFSFACLSRGAAQVISVEPDFDNFELLEKNLMKFGDRSVRIRGAVWHEGHNHEPLVHCGYEFNTASGSVIPHQDGKPIAHVSIDTLIGFLGEVDLLKIDAEGGEVVLFTSKRLSQVKDIRGEWHVNMLEQLGQLTPIPGVDFTVAGLQKRLELSGFAVEMVQTNHNLGLFFAKSLSLCQPQGQRRASP